MYYKFWQLETVFYAQFRNTMKRTFSAKLDSVNLIFWKICLANFCLSLEQNYCCKRLLNSELNRKSCFQNILWHTDLTLLSESSFSLNLLYLMLFWKMYKARREFAALYFTGIRNSSSKTWFPDITYIDSSSTFCYVHTNIFLALFIFPTNFHP
jgi:hypothetical protein